jgi:hypothetical protein
MGIAYVELLGLSGPGLDRPGLVVELCEFCADHVCWCGGGIWGGVG